MMNKKIILIAGALAAVGILLLIILIPGKKEEMQAEQVEEVQEECPLGFSTKKYVADTIQVKSGESFSAIMQKLGLGAKDTYELTAKCNGVIDLRKIRSGNHFHAYYETTDSSRVLHYVTYELSATTTTVFQCVDSLAVWNVEKPVERQRKYADITITESLWNDMIAAGADPALIMTLDEVYQWSVNFFAMQKGDRFRVIYTQTLCEGKVISIDTLHFSLFNSAAGKEVAACSFSTDGGRPKHWDKGGESLKKMFLKAPLKYTRISSGFTYHRKHPITGKVKAHTAVDYAAPMGTPVQAIGDGTVTICGWDKSGGGNWIKIKHGRGYETSYMHLQKFAPGVKKGSHVIQGQTIGYVGSTGSSTGPHLDFRVWKDGKPINPLSLDSPASAPLEKKYLDRFNAVYEGYMQEIAKFAQEKENTK